VNGCSEMAVGCFPSSGSTSTRATSPICETTDLMDSLSRPIVRALSWKPYGVWQLSQSSSAAVARVTDGRLTGTPTAASVGTYSNIVISSDGAKSASLAAFTITVNQISNGSATVTWTPPTQNSDGTVLT